MDGPRQCRLGKAERPVGAGGAPGRVRTASGERAPGTDPSKARASGSGTRRPDAQLLSCATKA